MNAADAIEWVHVGVSFGSSTPFLIDGVNVWTLKWQSAPARPKAAVVDPVYGRTLHFPIYEIITGTRRTLFAAGEYSNNVFGFYVPSSDGVTPDPSGRGIGVYSAAPPGMPPLPPRRANPPIRVVFPGWPTWRAMVPYFPLAAALFSVPWVVFVVMMHIGGQGPARDNPNWQVAFQAECIAPAALGLFAAAIAAISIRPSNILSWGAWMLGSVGCIAVIVAMQYAG